MSPRSWRAVALVSLVVLVVVALAWWRLPAPGEEILVLTPAQVEFPAARAGEPAVAQVMISNLGDTPLSIDSIEVPEPFRAETAGLTVEAGLSAPLRLVFQSDVEGAHEAVLEVSAGRHRESVSLTAEVRGTPQLSVGANGVDFGRVSVGGVALAELQVSNTGDEALEIEELVAMNCFEREARSLRIEPGETSAIELRFRPPSAQPWEGVLQIKTNDPDRPSYPVTLRGTGVDGPVDATIAVTPGNLDFGRVPVGAEREGWLTVHNDGADLLTISSLVLPDGFESRTRGRSVAAGYSASIRVRFAPSRPGVHGGVVRLLSNDPEQGRVEVAIRGNGVAAGAAGATGGSGRAGSASELTGEGGGGAGRGLDGLAAGGSADGLDDFDLSPVGDVPGDQVADGEDGLAPPPEPQLLEDSLICMNTFCAQIPSDAVGEIRIDPATGVIELLDLDLPTIYAPHFETFDPQVTAGLGSFDIREGPEGVWVMTVPIEFFDRRGMSNTVFVTLTTGEGTPVWTNGVLLPGRDGHGDLGDGILKFSARETIDPGGVLGGQTLEMDLYVRYQARRSKWAARNRN